MIKFTKKEHDKLKEEMIAQLKSKGYEIVMDKKRNIAIAYNEFLLISNKKKLFFNPTSIASIHQHYSKNPKEIDYGQNITHEEALKCVDMLEKNIYATIEKIKDGSLFDYLPLSKQNKFNKNSNITLYKPDIKFTVNAHYFSQDEIALQIMPYVVHLDNSFEDNIYIFDDLAVLEINPYANLLNVLTPPIIDDKGVFNKRKWVKNSYIKKEDLVPGCIYKDAKGKLNLYIGEIKNKKTKIGTSFSYTNSIAPYIKLTPKWAKMLDTCSNMNKFIYKIINEAQKKDASDWFDLCKTPDKIKFIELDSIRFSNNDALIKIENCPYEYKISGHKFLLNITTKNS